MIDYNEFLKPDPEADARWRQAEGDLYYARQRPRRPRKQTCPHNHPQKAGNIWRRKSGARKGDRICILCKRARDLAFYGPRPPEGWWLKQQQEAKTHCPAGHPYDEENTYVKNGSRNCRSCHRRDERIRMREKRAAAKAK